MRIKGNKKALLNENLFFSLQKILTLESSLMNCTRDNAWVDSQSAPRISKLRQSSVKSDSSPGLYDSTLGLRKKDLEKISLKTEIYIDKKKLYLD